MKIKRFSSISQKSLRKISDIRLGKEVSKGLSKKTLGFRDKMLKEANSLWTPRKYSSGKVQETKEAVLKRLGRAENNKLSESEFQKGISDIMK